MGKEGGAFETGWQYVLRRRTAMTRTWVGIAGAWTLCCYATLAVAASVGSPSTHGGGDIVDSLQGFDKAYDATVLHAMSTASHAAGNSKLGELQREADPQPALTGTDSSSMRQQLRSFDKSYDASVASAFLSSEKAE